MSVAGNLPNVVRWLKKTGWPYMLICPECDCYQMLWSIGLLRGLKCSFVIDDECRKRNWCKGLHQNSGTLQLPFVTMGQRRTFVLGLWQSSSGERTLFAPGSENTGIIFTCCRGQAQMGASLNIYRVRKKCIACNKRKIEQ